MRESFHKELDTVSEQLVEMTGLAGSAISGATTALLDTDLHLAESVIASGQGDVVGTSSPVMIRSTRCAVSSTSTRSTFWPGNSP